MNPLDELKRLYGEGGALENPARYKWEVLYAETRALVSFENHQKIMGFYKQWTETRNPHYLDWIQLILIQCNATPSPMLCNIFAEGAALRLSGSVAGTPEKIIKDSAKAYAFRVMMNLIYAGSTLESASIKAAFQVQAIFKTVKPYKASGLEKAYVKEIRATGLETEHFEAWDQSTALREDEGSIAFWNDAKESWPECDDDLTGFRR